MENAQQALVAKEKGDNILASKLYIKAFEIEKEVALSLENDINNEPTRSVIFRSAASLANICELSDDAEELINKGLSGNPPKNIEGELRVLLREVNKNSFKIYVDKSLKQFHKKHSSSKSVRRVNLAPSIKHFSIETIKKVLSPSVVSHVRRNHVSH